MLATSDDTLRLEGPPAQTTAAQRLRGRQSRALALAPTRELAAQVSESFASYGRRLDARCAAIFGGVGQGARVKALRAGVDILVATPGRLLDMGFISRSAGSPRRCAARRQTVMFSATMPAEILGLAGPLLRSPAQVGVAPTAPAAPRVEQQVYFVKQAEKIDLLADVLAWPEAERVIVFTRTKHGPDKVARKLGHSRIQTAVIHGNKSLPERLQRDRGTESCANRRRLSFERFAAWPWATSSPRRSATGAASRSRARSCTRTRTRWD